MRPIPAELPAGLQYMSVLFTENSHLSRKLTLVSLL